MRYPASEKLEIIRLTAPSGEVELDCKVGLNVVLSDGDHLIGSRFGRTLWHLEREFVFECPICGKPHVHHETGSDYRAVEIASEPLSDENWLEFPEDVVLQRG